MQKLIIKALTMLGSLLLILILAACSSTPVITPPAAKIPTSPPESAAVTAPNTQFARMLDNIPYAFLAKHDIWFSNPGKIKEMYGHQAVNSFADVNNLPLEERKQFLKDMTGIARSDEFSIRYDIDPIIGFDYWMVDRQIFPSRIPPWTFGYNEGEFDEELIGAKLIEQGYTQMEYRGYSYYSIRGDFQANLDTELQQAALGSLNRIVVLDNAIITAPSTEILTGILDSAAGESESMLDNTAVQALTASLDEVLSGVIMSPDRVVYPVTGQPAGIFPFYFDIPENWGLLHQYELISMGYQESGAERTWTISLFYSDAQNASDDAGTLVNRMRSYEFNTQFRDRQGASMPVTPFTALFEVGDPIIKSFPPGTVLSVPCRFKPETGSGSWLTFTNMLRDLLFLAQDPKPYVKTLDVKTPAVAAPASTPLSFEDAEQELKEKGFTLSDTAEKASLLVGYRVAEPSFVPEGFVPRDHNGRSGTFVIHKVTPSPDVPYEVSQQYTQSTAPGAPQGPFFMLTQTTAKPEMAGVGQEDITIGGYPGRKLLLTGPGAQARLALHWNDGYLTYSLLGSLSGPLDEATLLKIAASMGPPK